MIAKLTHQENLVKLSFQMFKTGALNVRKISTMMTKKFHMTLF